MNRADFFDNIRSLFSNLTQEKVEEIQCAYWLAKVIHRDQKRDSGERYFEHCRRVAIILVEQGITNSDGIVVALLHDCIEDGLLPQGILYKIFGAKITRAIEVLSKTTPIFDKDGSVVGQTPKDINLYYEGIAMAPSWIQYVKLVDRIDNLRHMGVWGENRKQKYQEETRKFLIPIAQDTDPVLTTELERLSRVPANKIEV
jgi:GTP pyrophosphokinase